MISKKYLLENDVSKKNMVFMRNLKTAFYRIELICCFSKATIVIPIRHNNLTTINCIFDIDTLVELF